MTFGNIHASGARMGAIAKDATVCQADAHILDKTRMCKFYAKGRCKRGQACHFAHSEGELQAKPDLYKTQLCLDFARGGTCQLGPACSYAHGPQELRAPQVPKESDGAGSRRAHVAAAAQKGARVAEQQVEAVKAQIAELQAQLQAMQAATGATAGPKRVVGARPKQEDDDGELTCSAGSFSRQTTAEGPGWGDIPFSRMTSVDDDDAWRDLLGARAGSAAEGEEGEELLSFDVLVKNTFVTLVPHEAAQLRRASSAPPPARGSRRAVREQ